MLVPLSTPLPDAVVDTDWDEYAVVDVVDFLPGTTTMYEDDHLRTEIYRYRDRAPPPSTYENGERRYRVQRATRPLVERLGGVTSRSPSP
jgi:hypothetical protein